MRRTEDDTRETPSFKIADHKINNLLKRLREKSVCPCCAARALTYHGATLAENVMGTAQAIEILEGIIITLRKNNVPAPEPMSSTEAH